MNEELNNENIQNNESEISSKKNNEFLKKTLIFLGMIVFGFGLVYLMNYFFVENNNLKVNISTDKKVDYVKINGEQVLLSTKKYVSDLNYEMNYAIDEFVVFKYKNQDYYRYIKADNVVIIIEKSTLPSNCSPANNDTYSCYEKFDDFTDNYYFTKDELVYKLSVKNIDSVDYQTSGVIKYMIDTFYINV